MQRLGRIALTGVFVAVALVLAAKWFVAYDAKTLSVGDEVGIYKDSRRGGPYEVLEIADGKLKLQATHDASDIFWIDQAANIRER